MEIRCGLSFALDGSSVRKVKGKGGTVYVEYV